MKKSLPIVVLSSLVSLFLFNAAQAQAPQKMSYQSVIRDSNGDLVADEEVGVRIQILQGADNGPAVYEETHNVATNTNGLATLEIGAGTVVSGSLEDIEWADGPYFIKTGTDPDGGENYAVEGASQLLSVPYAFFANVAAKTTGNTGGGEPGVKTYQVGDLALGGIVFYVTDGGRHGLVAALRDQAASANWFTAPDNVSNPANHDEEGKKFTDWRLPTRHELSLMFKVLKDQGLGNFSEEFYWSATESDFQNSWRQQFEDGRQALINKNAPNNVRAVRSF